MYQNEITTKHNRLKLTLNLNQMYLDPKKDILHLLDQGVMD